MQVKQQLWIFQAQLEYLKLKYFKFQMFNLDVYHRDRIEKPHKQTEKQNNPPTPPKNTKIRHSISQKSQVFHAKRLISFIKLISTIKSSHIISHTGHQLFHVMSFSHVFQGSACENLNHNL